MYVCKYLFNYSRDGILDHSLEVRVAPLPHVYTHGADSHHFKLGFIIFNVAPLYEYCMHSLSLW